MVLDLTPNSPVARSVRSTVRTTHFSEISNKIMSRVALLKQRLIVVSSHANNSFSYLLKGVIVANYE